MAKKTLAEQIKEQQDKLLQIRTRQSELKALVESEEYELTEEETTELTSLREDAAATEKKLTILKGLEADFAERRIGQPQPQTEGSVPTAPAFIPARREPQQTGNMIVQLGLIKAIAHLTRRSEQSVLEERYKNNQALRAVFDYTKRTAVAPADTTTTAWAAELVQTDIRGFLGTLEPNSVAAALANRSLNLMFDGYQSITVPRMNPLGATPTEPAWVGEGGVIPLTTFSFGSAIINRYKLAAITTLTMELVERSTPQAEAVLRDGMQKAYAKVLDHAFLSALGAVAGVRPAGILNNVTVAAGNATVTPGMAAVLADIKTMVGALVAAEMNTRPVLILNSVDRLGLGMITSPLGEMVFQSEIEAGRLLGLEVVSSNNVPVGTAILIDAAALATAFDTPTFDISQVATVVEANADNQPPTQAVDGAGALGTPGQVGPDMGIPVSSTAVAAGAGAANYTARSLWQTFSEGIRMIAPTSWALLRPNAVHALNQLKWS